VRFQLLLILPFVAGVAWGVLALGVPFDVFLYGSGSWGIGGILKMIAYHGIVRRMPHEGRSLWRVSLANGLVSGISELGASLLVFSLVAPMSLPDLVAFGVGIGAIEAILVVRGNPLVGTELEGASRTFQQRLAELPAWRRFVHGDLASTLERWVATGLHVGTRGLVYVGYRTGSALPVLGALGVFLLVDGMGYRWIYSGALEDLRTRWRFLGFLGALAAGTIGAFLWAWSGTM
jgi:hypothetical protein